MAVLQTCCGCCGVHVGVLIIGILGILSPIFIFTFSFPSHKDLIFQEPLQDNQDATGILDFENDNDIGTIIATVAQMAISALLILGVTLGKKALLVPYMITALLGMLFIGLITLSMMLYLPASLFSVGILIIVLGLQVYFFLVVWSHYQKLNTTNQGVIYNHAQYYENDQPLVKAEQPIYIQA